MYKFKELTDKQKFATRYNAPYLRNWEHVGNSSSDSAEDAVAGHSGYTTNLRRKVRAVPFFPDDDSSPIADRIKWAIYAEFPSE